MFWRQKSFWRQQKKFGARTFFGANFFGVSDVFATQSADLSDALVISVGLKVLYSYITIGCSIYSYDTDVGLTQETVNGVSYSVFSICGCSLHCPVDSTTVGGTVDVSADVPGKAQNGLGSYAIGLPNGYVQTVDLTADPSFSDEKATVEIMYQNSVGEVGHCAANVFTSAPAKLNGQLYQCCTEKSDIEKLAETSAFSSLVLTFAVIATTIAFYPFSPEVAADEVEEMRGGLFGQKYV